MIENANAVVIQSEENQWAYVKWLETLDLMFGCFFGEPIQE